MKREELENLISELVTALLMGTDITLVDVEYVREKDWYLRIYIDKPGGVEIDDCQLVSEKLTTALDDRDPIKEKYYLEVSSPGIDRPLKKDKEYEAAYGNKIDIAFYSPWEGLKEIVAILEKHTEDILQVRTIIKGREAKSAVTIDRKLISMVRPHIDF